MSSRIAPVWGLVCGVLALACTPLGAPALDLELPYSDPLDAELEWQPEVDDVEPPGGSMTEVEVSAEAELPSTHCRAEAESPVAIEVGDPADPGGGRLLTQLGDGRVMALPLRHTSFDTMVVGTVAETTVTQRFANPLTEVVEVVYTFPLPHDGAVDEYWLRIGKRRIEGTLRERQDAQRLYEQAKDEGHAAGLLTQERPNVFTQHVANVAPGEAIEVSMHVVQPLRPDQGRYELVLPTVVGPRFVPGSPTGTRSGTGMLADTDAVPDASRISPPILPPGLRTCGDLEITVSIDAGGPITALSTKSHRIQVEPDHLGAMVRLDQRYELLDRDFVLGWRRDTEQPRATLQAQPDADGDGGYFTLTVQPPQQVDPKDVPGQEVVFVVDASGSMSGPPMDAAKATMRRFIEGLGPDDAFQVIRFSEAASGLGDDLLPVTDDTVAQALTYVDGLQGQGGTMMTEGIKASLGMAHRSDRLRYVVFLTDGFIGNEAEIFELIAERIGDARLFSLGVGSSVNRYLLEGMARMGRGSVTYVDLEEPAAPVADAIYEKLRHPALVDLQVEVEGLEVRHMVPAKVPDLLLGQPVVLFGRYEGPLRGRVVVRGRRGGELVEVPVRLAEVRDEDVDGVRSMWARGRIDQLRMDPSLAYASQARREAIDHEVLELSLAHRVLTEQTAFVAIDRTRVVEGRSRGRTTSRTIVQGVDMAAGVAFESTWGRIGPAPSGTRGLGLVGAGGGSGSGYGQGSGAGFGGRGTRIPRVRQARAMVKGSLDKSIIQRIVRAHINEVRHCYNQGLVADPSLAGRIVLDFVIDELGRVAVAVVASSTVDDEAVGLCIAKTAKRWKFPKAEGAGKARVKYPFVLSPG